jgi:hypothetical protein
MVADSLKTFRLFIVMLVLTVLAGCDDSSSNNKISDNSSIDIFNIASKKGCLLKLKFKLMSGCKRKNFL